MSTLNLKKIYKRGSEISLFDMSDRVNRKRAASESLLQDETAATRIDEPFPRGGGSSVAPVEIKRAATEATHDVFQSMNSAKKARKTKKKSPVTVVPINKRIEPLVFSKIKTGTLVLGQISSLSHANSELVVDLPNNLTGFCKVDDITIYQSKSIGKFLRFIVTDLGNEDGKKKRINMSLDPNLVNQCVPQSEVIAGSCVQGIVSSVEDKGYIMDLGTELGTGFMAMGKKELSEASEGQCIMMFIKGDPNQRIKNLTTDPSAGVITVINQPALVPGTLVNSAPLEKETKFGNLFSLLGQYSASSDSIHSQGTESAVRVLFSYPPLQLNGERQLGVSNLSNIVNLEGPKSSKIKVGEVVNTEITKVCDSLGTFVSIMGAGTAAATVGFAHISQIGKTDKVDLLNDAEYAVGTIHPARVMSFNEIDNIFYVSLNPDVITQQYLSINDVRIGDVVKHATIDRIMSRGDILVKLNGPVIGIASEMQLNDAAIKNPELRYKPGQKVSARVLNVNTEKQKVYITLKKSIVEDKEPILDSYTQDESWHVGTVTKFIDSGAIILFFNHVQGLLPASEMSEVGVHPKDLLRVGETVRCRILSADASVDRLILSLRPESQLENLVGSVKSAVVISKTKQEIHVQIQETGSDKILGEAVLVGKPKLNVNDTVEVKILNGRLVSTDENIIRSKLPSSANDLQVGDQVYGFVSGSHPQAGLFIQFQQNFSGLVPANLLSKLKPPAVGSVIEVVVDSIDFAKNRAFFSLPAATPKVSCTINSVKQTQLNITTSDGHQGRIDSSMLFNSIDEIEDPKNPLSQFKTNDVLDNLTVFGRHDAKNHRFLPLSHKSGSNAVYEVGKYKPKQLKVGSRVLAFVNNYSADKLSLWVTISPQQKAQLSLVDLSPKIEILEDPQEYYPIGSAIQIKILKLGNKISATALEEDSNLCVVTEVDPFKLTVRLPYHKTSIVECTDTGDVFSKLKDTFSIGDVLPFHMDNNRVSLKKDGYNTVKDFSPGAVVYGFVRNIASSGIFISLAHKVVARVQIKEISDKYLKDWQKFVHVGDVIQGKILSNDGRIEMTMKRSSITGKSTQNIDDIEVGSIHKGLVRSVAAFGVFVDFQNVTGLAHKSEISDHIIADLTKVFKPGDRVRIKVLDKTIEDGRISLGMKAKYFDDVEDDDDDDDEYDDQGENISDVSDAADDDEELPDEDSSSESIEIQNIPSDSDSLDEDEEESDSSDDEETEKRRSIYNNDTTSGLSAGFDWSGEVPTLQKNDDSDNDDDSDSDSENEGRKRKRRTRKEEFVKDETASLQNKLPQSAKDFERLLVSSPNSSMLWMNYMAFELQLGEIEGSRNIARRALKTIKQSKEEERLNIWIALLNLEARFGTKESLDAIFRESQQYMDATTMHLRMATILAEAGRTADALKMYQRAQKRFGGENMEVWLTAMRYLFSSVGNNKTLAREMGERAVQRLPERMHKDFTKQFALLEFELGDAERGRTLFEALISVAPKRVDIWNVYLDQEIKLEEADNYARLFERVIQQKISMKQAKFFFKKWISVAADQEYVTNKARDYVSSREKRNGNDNESDSEGEDEEDSDASENSDEDEMSD